MRQLIVRFSPFTSSSAFFQPIETLGCFRKLKSLALCCVHITEEGLNQLLTKSSGLEQLQIYLCSKIICLKIPCTLQKLKFLGVRIWHKMQVVEISAPNLSTFQYSGLRPTRDQYQRSFPTKGCIFGIFRSIRNSLL